MEELIAKRYVKALVSVLDKKALNGAAGIFSSLASELNDDKFREIINNPDVSDAIKEEILLAGVKSAKSTVIDNMIKLLIEKKRLGIIPAISHELKQEMARMAKSYTGQVLSNSDVDSKTLAGLSKDLGKKLDAKITLEFQKTDFDGIKVEVEDLGVEINFSKTRLNTQLVEHILKAI